jgi:hypothetical protein
MSRILVLSAKMLMNSPSSSGRGHANPTRNQGCGWGKANCHCQRPGWQHHWTSSYALVPWALEFSLYLSNPNINSWAL